MNATTQTTSPRSTVKADLAARAAVKAANPKAKNLDKVVAAGSLKAGSHAKPGKANTDHKASVKAAIKAGVKAKADAPKVTPADTAKAKADKKAADKLLFIAKMEAQKAATAAKHHAQKLFSSFTARVKYMAYMDNPEFGGLDGREAIGWTLTHINSIGAHYSVTRQGDSVLFNTGKTLIVATGCSREEVAKAMEEISWTA